MKDRKTEKYLETIRENCMNCGKKLSFRMYVEATEFDAETGTPTKNGWDFIHGEASCRCGAELLIADDYDSFHIYWLNKDKMPKDTVGNLTLKQEEVSKEKC